MVKHEPTRLNGHPGPRGSRVVVRGRFLDCPGDHEVRIDDDLPCRWQPVLTWWGFFDGPRVGRQCIDSVARQRYHKTNMIIDLCDCPVELVATDHVTGRGEAGYPDDDCLVSQEALESKGKWGGTRVAATCLARGAIPPTRDWGRTRCRHLQ